MTPRTLWPCIDSLRDITPHQRTEVSKSLAGPFGMLLGYPGGGKTFVLGSVIHAVAEQQGIGHCVVCAPTGKAAVRITENLQRYGLPIEATTIHRALGISRCGHDGRGWGFKYNARNKLPARFVFVDEISMGDTETVSKLFSALNPGTHVLLVGDPNQLPPVGSGAPLRDLIAAGVPCGTLTEIIRNSGDITEACRQIRTGGRPLPSQFVNVAAGNNWLHRECHRPALQIEEIKTLLRSCPAGIDPIRDVQILCAVNEGRECARKELNAELQAVLNPHARTIGDKFRIGDKVICTSNTMLELANDGTVGTANRRLPNPREFADECLPDAPKEFVANGEIGYVIGPALDPRDVSKIRGLIIEIEAPRRRVIVTLSGKKTEMRGDVEHVGAACDFDLAYAITTHKAQGSQAPVIIAAVDERAKFVASREWWYTAVSRPEKLLITVGQLSAMHRQCKRSELVGRKTFLAEKLRGKMNAVGS